MTTDPPPEEFVLDRERLLAQLNMLLAADSLAQLRQGLAALEQSLLAGELLAANGSEQLVVPREYLLAELSQVHAAFGLDRACYYLDRLVRSLTAVRANPLNDLNLNRWKTYGDILTDSLWQIERRDSSGVHTAGYWGNFVPQIPYQLMRRYTRPGDWVIDTFAGSGTTLIEAQRHGRNCLGVELQDEVASQARALVAATPNAHGTLAVIETGDSASVDFGALLGAYGQAQAQLVIMHPPYHDIIKFSDDPRDLSNQADVAAFLRGLGAIVDNVAPVLANGRYLALVIGDKYSRGEWVPLGFQAMNEVLQRQFRLKSIVVKNFESTTGKRQQRELWRYRALAGGFYVFKHEYIFLFRKYTG